MSDFMMTLAEKQAHFEERYSQVFDKLYRYMYVRIPHAADCEDLVAEVMLSAYSHLEQYDPAKGNLEQWLMGSARYHVIDYWRGQRVTLEFDEAILLLDALDRETGLETTIDQKIMVEKMFATLPAEVLALLNLRYSDGLTYEEIAHLTQKQPASVRQFFSRLHKKLQLEFQQYSV